MAQSSTNTGNPPATAAEVQEPADDTFYRTLAISFLVGMVFIFALFIFILVILAGAS